MRLLGCDWHGDGFDLSESPVDELLIVGIPVGEGALGDEGLDFESHL